MTIKTVGILTIVVGSLILILIVALATQKTSITTDDGSSIDVRSSYFGIGKNRTKKNVPAVTKEEPVA